MSQEASIHGESSHPKSQEPTGPDPDNLPQESSHPDSQTSFETEQTYFAASLAKYSSKGRRCASFDSNKSEARYEDCTFLRHHVLENLINEEALQQRVFERLLHPTIELRRRYSQQILGPPRRRRCAILLVILCYGNYSMLERFENYFLKGSPQLFDKDLPFEIPKAKEIFGNGDGQKFYDHQFQLLPITLVDDTNGKIDTRRPLPYIEQEQIGEGAYGKVYSVRVERGHYSTVDGRVNPHSTMLLARKDFGSDELAYAAFKAETKILKDVINPKGPKNIAIVASICSYTYKFPDINTTFGSIFFEKAMCGLDDYIKNDKYRPTSRKVKWHQNRLLEEQRQNIDRITGICKALVWLSEKSAEDDDLPYYHCDVKPANILVYASGKGEDDPWVFKLADFGEARQKKKVSKFQAIFGSGHLNTRQTAGTHLAKERQDKKNALIKPKSEVWSFGCVLLLVLVFNRDGKRGIETFEKARRADPDGRGDHFFKTEGDGCKRIVTECMDDLINSSGGPAAQSLRKPFVTYVKKRMLVSHSDRHTLTDIRTTLHKMLKDSTCVEIKTIKHDVPEGIKYCTNSSSGTIFYHAPKAVHMYHEHTNFNDSIHPEVTSEWSTSIRPKYHSSSKQVIFVAETSYKHFIIIGYEPDKHFGVQTFGASTETMPELVAFSPNVRKLAIVYSLPQHFWAKIRVFDIPSIKNNSLDTPAEDPVLDVPLKSVNSNHDLFFSCNGQYLYHAYKLRRQNSPSVPELKVDMWDTVTLKPIATWRIPDQDTTTSGFFISSIVPMNNKPGFIFISHEKTIQKALVDSSPKATVDSSKAITTLMEIAGVKKVLLSSDDKRIVMLVVRGYKLEIYGSVLSGRNNQLVKLQILQPMTYDPNRDDATIQEDGLDMSILVTNCEKRTSYKCDLGSLFGAGTREV